MCTELHIYMRNHDVDMQLIHHELEVLCFSEM